MLPRLERPLAGLMLVTIALAIAAPAAHAGHRKYKRSHGSYCETRVVRHVHHGPRYVIRDRCDGSALAGFVGGLIVGAVVSHADAGPEYSAPRPAYDYYDPYCDIHFNTFDSCTPHFRHCDHPRVITVIETRSGRGVDRYRYEDGYWRTWDDDRDWDDDEN